MSSVLLLGKADHPHSRLVREFCVAHFTHVECCLGRAGEPFPAAAAAWAGNAIVSYLAPWIVPETALRAASSAAVNFHPAPPEFPGIGCVNFALYEGVSTYGVTCHHMTQRVDRGDIIEVRRFPIAEDDDVASVLERAYAHLLAMFHDVVARLAGGRPLPRSHERWSERLYTRRELNALATIRPDMSADEVGRRVRATTYRQWRPEVRIHGLRFAYEPEPRPRS